MEKATGSLFRSNCQSQWISSENKHWLAVNELEYLEFLGLHVFGHKGKLLTSHTVLECLVKRNQFNVVYTTRLTTWIDKLAQFDFFSIS